MSLKNLTFDMEELANSDGRIQDDALSAGLPIAIADGKTCVVGIDSEGTPLICKGVHPKKESLIADYIEEFRAEDSIYMILAGQFNADEMTLEDLTLH